MYTKLCRLHLKQLTNSVMRSIIITWNDVVNMKKILSFIIMLALAANICFAVYAVDEQPVNYSQDVNLISWGNNNKFVNANYAYSFQYLMS